MREHIRAVLVRAKQIYPQSRHLQRQWTLCKLRGIPPAREPIRIAAPVSLERMPRTLEEIDKARRVLL